MDVSAIVGAIDQVAVPAAMIGAAVLTLMVGIKGYHWVRRAF